MSDQDMFTDEVLTAYLDGEGEHRQRQIVEEALAANKDLRARLEKISIPVDDIRSAFNTLITSAPAYPLQVNRIATKSLGFAGLLRPIAATAVLCLLTGWYAAGLINVDRKEDWRRSVAVYHSLYVSDTLSDTNQTTAAMRDELTRVSIGLGKPITLEMLTTSKVLDYKRAQVLGVEGRPLIQLAFLSKTGTPVALCIFNDGAIGNANIKTGTMLGMATASWSKGDFDYLLLGGPDLQMIGDEAALFSALL
jgi:hypothetical protein